MNGFEGRNSSVSSAEKGASSDRARPKNVIAIIDYEEHTRGGHFGSWLMAFSNEFTKYFDQALVYTPDPDKTVKLFESSPEPRAENIAFASLPRGRRKRFLSSKRKKCALGDIFEDARKRAPSGQISGFVMWGYDLETAEMVRNPGGNPWATLIGFSWCERKYKNVPAAREGEVLTLCRTTNECVRVLCLDHFMLSPDLPKTVWIPAMQHLQLPEEQPPAVEQIRAHARDDFLIAAPGMLFGDRCVNEMLQLADCHPEIKFLLAGKLIKESVRPDLQPKLDIEKPANLMLMEGFLEEKALNAVIQAADAIFIDGANYPVHSSIATKALFFGKYLLTPESHSWTRDVIQQWNTGLAYRNRDADLISAWQEWKKSHGPENSKRAASALMSEKDRANCFEELTRALTQTGPHSFSSHGGAARVMQ